VRRALILAAVLVLAGCGGDEPAELPPQPAAREAPGVEGVTLEGERASLAALRGKPVVVNVWSSW
jgi:predicted small lipoprotein YifL